MCLYGGVRVRRDRDRVAGAAQERAGRISKAAQGEVDLGHGTANLHFVAGGRVRGGLYGETPRLDDLENGNMRHVIDFRSLYATVLERWLGANSRTVLGAGYPLLGAL